ncbi:MAG: nickel pincer cofactor biosynthesis protein LarC [Prolixibacteraceae bacterium]|nr:nickel pincer cofactor biosynthesis protein LarC [Prolixibacteraceae bacterium]MBN2650637.1 nickel pincer cofactor biosynthesis protein LarC [Prolixibacteraceae bacterium]
MKILYYDCFAGISGDMNLGAMIDLGVDPAYLKNELSKLNIEGFELKVEPDMRRGISGTKVTVVIDNPDNEKHRHLRHVEEIVNNSTLPEKVKSTSLDIFSRIAEAEAKVHNIDIQKVHFHEVGALDSIADIVGAAICLDYLKVDKVLSSPIQLGGGTVKCAHGVMPVPAPATAIIVENIPVKTGLVQHEATTPTGAAILAATVDEFTGQLSYPIAKTAYGIGQRDVSEVPNILRLYLCETSDSFRDVTTETETMLECNIDDMNAEHFGDTLERLLNAGASDAWFTPIIMKKSRPATKLSVLCKTSLTDKMKAIIFEHTTSLGIREYPVQKSMLRREEKTVKTSYGEVRVKESFFNGKRVNAKPEYNDCKQLADKNNVPLAIIENEVRKQL